MASEGTAGLAAVSVIVHDGTPVAAISGEIDLSNADSVLDQLEQAVEAGARGLVVDLGGVEYLDSTGVRLLVRLVRVLASSDLELRLVVPAGAPIRRVLELANIEAALPVDETTDDALRKLRD